MAGYNQSTLKRFDHDILGVLSARKMYLILQKIFQVLHVLPVEMKQN